MTTNLKSPVFRSPIPLAHKVVVWKRTETSKGEMILPYFKYGQEHYPVPRGEWDVWLTRWNPEQTPRNMRGELNEDSTILYY